MPYLFSQVGCACGHTHDLCFIGNKPLQNEAFTFHCGFLEKDCDFVSTDIGVRVATCPDGAIEILKRVDKGSN
jgi:hypothetical protein